MIKRTRLFFVVLAVAAIAAPAAFAAKKDTAYYILPPGNYGGLPTGDNSLDQLPLYSGLTPLRDRIDQKAIREHFLRQDFKPIGETREEDTGRKGLKLIYDKWGVPHVYGKTREDMA